MSAPSLIRHDIRGPSVPAPELVHKVGNSRVGVRYSEREPVSVASAGEGDSHGLAPDFHTRRTVRQHDAHSKSPKNQRLARLTLPEARSEASRDCNKFLDCSHTGIPRTQFLSRASTVAIHSPADAHLSTSTPALSLKAQTQAARSILHRPPGRAAPTSQRRISRADTAPRLNAAMSQSLDARQDLIGQCLSRRSWGDAQPAKPSPNHSAAEAFRHG